MTRTEEQLVWLLRESFDADEIDPAIVPDHGWHELSVDVRPSRGPARSLYASTGRPRGSRSR